MDAAVMDADLGTPDADGPDVWDADIRDADLPDGEISDADLPDGEIPDADLPDVDPPDADLPDAEPPEVGGLPAWARWDQALISVPEGTFVRGSRLPDQPADEKPQRAIAMSAFQIHRDEVSLRAWADCVDAGHCAPPSAGEGCTWPQRERAPRRPVNCVTRAQARVYCQALGGDLPTEAQWAYAARGACNQRGEAVCEQGVDDPDLPWAGVERTCRQVRSAFCLDWAEGPDPVWWRSPDGDSILGLRNMAGNVAEWVRDDYVADAYAADAEVDPFTARPGAPGVVRGGHYATVGIDGLRVADRQPADPSVPRATYGLRCVFTP